MAEAARSLNAAKGGKAAAFQWDDPFLIEEQLSEDERKNRDTARARQPAADMYGSALYFTLGRFDLRLLRRTRTDPHSALPLSLTALYPQSTV